VLREATLLLALGLVSACGRAAEPSAPEPPHVEEARPTAPDRPAKRTPAAADPAWRVTHQLSAHYVLVMHVETARIQNARAIAQQLIEPVKDEYAEAVIYFYRPAPGGATLVCRVQWTPRGGYSELPIED
jgi:hypothetical protein